jgi:hypothetical protein
MTWDPPTDKECLKCGSLTIQKSVEGEKYIVCLNEECGHKTPVEKDIVKNEPVGVK